MHPARAEAMQTEIARDMASRYLHLIQVRRDLHAVRPRRRDRRAHALALLDLDCEMGKMYDTLCVYGFGAGLPNVGIEVE